MPPITAFFYPYELWIILGLVGIFVFYMLTLLARKFIMRTVENDEDGE